MADAGGEALDCKDELTLSRAAAELLLRDEPPSPEALTVAVREAGSDLVGVRAFYWRERDQSGRKWLLGLKGSADAPLVCGFAESDIGRLLLAAPRAGSLEPLSSRSTQVRGKVAEAFHDPELVLADASGELQRIPIDRRQLAQGVAIAPELRRPVQVQLLAHGPAGPRPLAERLLPASDEVAVRGEPMSTEVSASDDAAPELAIGARLTQLRQRQGRVALRENQLLGRVAAEHAERVCKDGRIVHELAPGDDPQRRLRDAGVEARRVGETVARAQSGSSAFAAFERSPSHRLTLLEPGFTDAGIGVSKDPQGRSCVVILLAAWPRYVGR
jgi:uncharacterized protein YkwD